MSRLPVGSVTFAVAAGLIASCSGPGIGSSSTGDSGASSNTGDAGRGGDGRLIQQSQALSAPRGRWTPAD
jgi:hypothetical protein